MIDQPFFEDVEPMVYAGPDSDDPFSFRWYDADRVVAGRTMTEHLRMAVCYWHSFVWPGSDVFGDAFGDFGRCCQIAAEDDRLRVHKVHHRAQGHGQGPSDLFGCRSATGPCVGLQTPPRSAGALWAVGIDHHVADLAGEAVHSTDECPIDHQASTDADATRHVDERPQSDGRSRPQLRKRAEVRLVVDTQLKPERLVEPGEVHIEPVQVRGDEQSPRRWVHQTGNRKRPSNTADPGSAGLGECLLRNSLDPTEHLRRNGSPVVAIDPMLDAHRSGKINHARHHPIDLDLQPQGADRPTGGSDLDARPA